MNTLEITTGIKRIDIIRDGKNVGQISFNPTDAFFAERFYTVLTEFRTEMDEYKKKHMAIVGASKNEDKLESAPEQIQLLKETCGYVRDRIDFLFGKDTSNIVFGDALVLEAFEQFFEKISPFIQGVRAKKLSPYLPPTSKNGHRTKKPRVRK